MYSCGYPDEVPALFPAVVRGLFSLTLRDPATFPRRIQYTSGEIEELDLGDIVRERQMSLLPQRT